MEISAGSEVFLWGLHLTSYAKQFTKQGTASAGKEHFLSKSGAALVSVMVLSGVEMSPSHTVPVWIPPPM